MKTITSFSDENREMTLDNAGWYRDTTACFESFDHDAGPFFKLENEGAHKRLLRFANVDRAASTAARLAIDWQTKDGQGFFIYKLISDLGDLDFGILPGIPVKLEFTLNSPEFYLMAHPDVIGAGQQPAVEIVAVHAKVLQHEMPSDVYQNIMRPITDKKKTIQSFTQMRLTTQTMRIGSISWPQDNFMGSDDIGQRIFLAFVNTEALAGHWQKSPLNWKKEFEGPNVNEPATIKDVIVTIDVCNSNTFYCYILLHAHNTTRYFLFIPGQ